MDEIWKPVVGFESRYEVSNMGRLRSLPHETVVYRRGGKPYTLKKCGAYISPQPRQHGYMAVWLYGNGGNNGRIGKQYSVHRIVAEAFLPNPNGCIEVNHVNEDKADNRACNLEWCTHKENSSHGTRGKRIGLANLNGKKSKKVFQYLPNGNLVAEYPSMAEVQRRTGFRKGNIWKQMNGERELAYGYKWSHSPSLNTFASEVSKSE